MEIHPDAALKSCTRSGQIRLSKQHTLSQSIPRRSTTDQTRSPPITPAKGPRPIARRLYIASTTGDTPQVTGCIQKSSLAIFQTPKLRSGKKDVTILTLAPNSVQFAAIWRRHTRTNRARILNFKKELPDFWILLHFLTVELPPHL